VAGIRALGGAGVPVIAVAARRGAAGLWSRYATERALGPSPFEPDAFVARIAELTARRGTTVVYPGQEEAVGALIARARSLPANALLPYPGDPDAVQALRDKVRLAELSARAGLGSPALLAHGRAGDVLAAPPEAPCVLKPRDFSEALPHALRCETADELRDALSALPEDEPVLVQELASGPLVAVSVVLDRDGRVRAQFQQVARRLWPTAAGASSLGVSVAPDPELIDRVAGLLRGAGYWGLAQVQLLTTASGPAAIDVNPRFYGSLPLPTAAGVNLPLAWHEAALGRPAGAVPAYRAGVTYRWLEGELTAAWNGERERLRSRAPRPRAGAMWQAGDPAASAIMAADAAAPRLRRLLPGRRRA
jgi:predicted ATP-grasp superfamily ATP-dependent carboligase